MPIFELFMLLKEILLVLGMSFYADIHAQSNPAFQQQVGSMYFQAQRNGLQKKRDFLSNSQSHSVVHWVSGGMIYFYQNILSEQIQADCTYETTCSEYLKQCISTYGFWKGTMAGLNQYMKCGPNNAHNHLAYKLNTQHKIKNQVQDE